MYIFALCNWYLNLKKFFKGDLKSTFINFSSWKGLRESPILSPSFYGRKPWVLKQFAKEELQAKMRLEPKILKSLVTIPPLHQASKTRLFPGTIIFTLIICFSFSLTVSTISRGISWALVLTSCPGEVPGCFLIAHWAYIFNGEKLFVCF